MADKFPTANSSSSDYLQYHVTNSTFMTSILEAEVRTDINKLNKNISMGPENVPSKFYKIASSINSTFSSWTF